ncbi:MAG TPA: carboxypeptidase regulatory-like domain-containing protein [Acidobacteriota bacterium]|nr:carboxypeptidase regulatory-like domain-containing protein [Acidobacteriota bacterium]
MKPCIALAALPLCCAVTLPCSASAASRQGSSPGVRSGSITGIVTFNGPLPRSARIDMAQEPVCAQMHGGPTISSMILAGPNNTLGNVIVYISRGLNQQHYDPPKEPLVIDQKGCIFEPHVLAIQAHQKLLVLNSDPTMHNIHPLAEYNPSWNRSQTETMSPIETSFAHEEIAIRVKCNVHPWMKGYIAVFAHPYFAVTGREGRFELKNLPPGTYTITAWHETFGTIEKQVTVGSEESKKLEFAFRTLGD